MKNVYDNVAGGGMDVHYEFGRVTMRDAKAGAVRHERLDHRDRAAMVAAACAFDPATRPAGEMAAWVRYLREQGVQ